LGTIIDTGAHGDVQFIKSGRYFNCAITQNNGAIVCWGSNSMGQIGNEDNTQVNIGDQANEMGSSLTSVDIYGGP